ncbi:MAG TPA: hypothetical protein H9680_04545 [Firmicutes bacterium]|nr:hypothetical protein [Bacillota bacterium]
MNLDSFSFIFVFLPLSLGAYYLAPPRRRPAVVLGVSLVFYVLLEGRWILLMAASLGVDFAISRAIHRFGPRDDRSRRLLALAVGKSLLLMLGSTALRQIYQIHQPLGIYLYTLSSLGYLIDLYWGEIDYQPSLVNYGVLCCFFGKLYAGPLVEAKEFFPQLKDPRPSLDQVGEGMMIFVQGLAKKVILADGIISFYQQLAALTQNEMSVIGAWATVFAAMFTLYFRLSAYCDMAKGLGRMFGLELPDNFYYPIQSRTVTDFFSRFNMTVSRYIRHYVYGSLGSDQNGGLSTSLNVMLTAMLMGLWFGLGINYLMWGVFLGAFIVVETLFGQRIIKVVPPFFLRIYTFAVTLLSFALFATTSLRQASQYLQAMFGRGGIPFLDNEVLYLFSTNYLVLILCLLLSTSLFHTIFRFLRRQFPSGATALGALGNLALLALTVALML